MPSRSRGLRTSTGCLTCRKRRVKCDEERPQCKNCLRVERSCVYAQANTTPRRTLHGTSSVSQKEPERSLAPRSASPRRHSTILDPEITLRSWDTYKPHDNTETTTTVDEGSLLCDTNFLSFGNVVSPSLPLGPFEWYDLLAEDAITNLQEQNASGHENRWNFDKFSLSRKQTPRHTPAPENTTSEVSPTTGIIEVASADIEPWNTNSPIPLSRDEHIFFEHYVTVVGPILDLFDPARHFSSIVPHLALRNTGLLKSLLAVGARHMALIQSQGMTENDSSIAPPSTPASIHSTSGLFSNAKQTSEQYYYETLHYLSQTLLYPSYTTSHEILATAIMISTYEMFGAYSSSDSSNWERHLRGAFWIQRNQDNDGESIDGLRQAVWWAWLRQDIWAAFRMGRPALTIWQPKKSLIDLTPDELTTRVVYITAKCVQFAATPKDNDIAGYIEAGESLLRILESWKQVLPSSFEPIPMTESHASPMASMSDSLDQFGPIWIHPPSHAAAMQMYHFARIIIVLNQPSIGGLAKYQHRSKLLRESMSNICGIANAQQSQNVPSAFVNFQAVYAAALCAETQGKQADVLVILERTLKVCKFPAGSMVNDLLNVWGSTT